MALLKLKIEAFSDPECTSSVGDPIEAMFNPNTYTRKYKAEYNAPKVIGQNDRTLIFQALVGNDMTLKLVADGTGVVPLPKGVLDVDDYIKKIKQLTYSYNGLKHRPNYLTIVWGSLSMICVCKGLNVSYNLFKEDGTALRASIELLLSGTTDFVTVAKEAKKSSPDLTHMRTVNAGDTLPLMTFRIYGDSSYYMEVAKINNLTSINGIKPGDQLYFPPIKK